MRNLALTVGWLLAAGLVIADESGDKPLTPAEAARAVNKRITVQMEVQSTGTSKNKSVIFLNSEPDFRNHANFTIVINSEVARSFKDKKIDDPAAHFKGKTVRVTGKVMLYKDRPQIVLDDPEQIRVVEKK